MAKKNIKYSTLIKFCSLKMEHIDNKILLCVYTHVSISVGVVLSR